jgi:tRNA pseudouridine38-40 synthase
MRTLKITLAYDGTDFVGWQRQPSGTSIQGLLEAAFAPLEPSPVTIAGAGRTDAGVHALRQVASVASSSRLSCADLRRALNAALPERVRVIEVEEADDRFHARFAARAKTYRYRLLNGPVGSPFETRYAWHVTHALDLRAMSAALDICRGEHDFAAFQAAGSLVKGSVRRLLDALLIEQSVIGGAPGRLVTIELRGTGFLRHMVRNIAGTLVEIGRGRWTPDDMRRILESRDRALAGPTAPAHGLFLVEVEY